MSADRFEYAERGQQGHAPTSPANAYLDRLSQGVDIFDDPLTTIDPGLVHHLDDRFTMEALIGVAALSIGSGSRDENTLVTLGMAGPREMAISALGLSLPLDPEDREAAIIRTVRYFQWEDTIHSTSQPGHGRDDS